MSWILPVVSLLFLLAMIVVSVCSIVGAYIERRNYSKYGSNWQPKEKWYLAKFHDFH